MNKCIPANVWATMNYSLMLTFSPPPPSPNFHSMYLFSLLLQMLIREMALKCSKVWGVKLTECFVTEVCKVWDRPTFIIKQEVLSNIRYLAITGIEKPFWFWPLIHRFLHGIASCQSELYQFHLFVYHILWIMSSYENVLRQNELCEYFFLLTFPSFFRYVIKTEKRSSLTF